MWIDDHPYLFFYLTGCIFVALLISLKIIIFLAIGWITKGNILKRNFKKVLPPEEGTFTEKASGFLILFAFDAALSWISVVVVLWQIATELLRTLRELLSPIPEAIKMLRFPLRNNPDMSRESVWAYLFALQIKVGGKQPTETELLGPLNEIFSYYPSFNRSAALKQLASLNVISPEVLSAAMGQLSRAEGEI